MGKGKDMSPFSLSENAGEIRSSYVTVSSGPLVLLAGDVLAEGGVFAGSPAVVECDGA